MKAGVAYLFGGNGQHRDLSPAFFVSLAVNTNHIALFKLNRNQNVCGRGNCENQMTDSHLWRRPEGDDETVPFSLRVNWFVIISSGPKWQVSLARR
jgi:hypothetical protein